MSPAASILQSISDESSLDDALQQLVEAEVAPGLSVVVVKDGKPAYMKSFGFADAARTTPVSPDSGFNLWSVSKVFTQLAILELVETGQLGLDDPICDHITWMKARQCSSDSGSVTSRTIRTLLNHTAGIPDIGIRLYAETQFDGDRIPGQKTLSQQLLTGRDRWKAPAVSSRYSNSHYLLLAAIIEQVSGQSFSQYLQTYILEPAGMLNTGVRYKPGQPVMAGTHTADLTSFFAFFLVDKVRAVRIRNDDRYWFNNVYNTSLGSSGLISNSHDMANFVSAMLSCLRNKNGPFNRRLCNHILESTAVEVTKSPARGVADLGQKLGWFVSPTSLGETFSHGGSGMGYTAMLQLFPQQNLGIFVVANDSYFDQRGGLSVSSAIARINW